MLGIVYGSEGFSPLTRRMEQVRRVAWLLRDRIPATPGAY
jgi:hypothetical protein